MICLDYWLSLIFVFITNRKISSYCLQITKYLSYTVKYSAIPQMTWIIVFVILCVLYFILSISIFYICLPCLAYQAVFIFLFRFLVGMFSCLWSELKHNKKIKYFNQNSLKPIRLIFKGPNISLGSFYPLATQQVFFTFVWLLADQTMAIEYILL